MRAHSGWKRPAVLLAAGATLLAPGAAAAQDGGQPTAAPRLVFDYTSRFEVDTNQDLDADSPGTATNFDQILGLSYLTETQLQSFSLQGSATARLGRDPELDDTVTEFNQGGLELDYSRRGSRSALSFGATYRRNEVEANDLIFFDDQGGPIIDEAGLSRDDATVTTLGFNTSLRTGLDRPLSTTYRFSVRDRSYSDNDDPDLYDNRSASAGITTSLDLSPVMTARVSADYRQYEYDDLEQTEGEEASISTGLTYDVDPTLQVDGSIGYSEDREELLTLGGDREEEVSDGLIASLGFTKQRPLGAISGDYTRDVTDDGVRDSISIGRELNMPGYNLTGRIGLTSEEDSDPDTLFLVAYDRPLPDGSFSASVQRRVSTNTVDDESILTLATLDYSRRMTPLTSLSLGLDVARIAETEAEDQERTELGFTATVNRSITENWSLGMGYNGRYEELETGEEATSNSVFVTLGRQFTIRP